jgi:heme-degrading monooxygenase HmoA
MADHADVRRTALSIASVHLADLSFTDLLGVLRRAPDPKAVPGLRSARVALATPMRTSFLPRLGRRVALVSFWDDEPALDAFETSHRTAAVFAPGFTMRLAPLRAYGSWPGLDTDLPRARHVDYVGPAAVLTLGRTRFSQLPRFLRASRKAEAATANAAGLLWATAMARPPFVATFSMWENSDAIAAFAFDSADAAHPAAIREGRAKPFHHEEAFVRFRPIAASGSLEGSNPLREGLLI